MHNFSQLEISNSDVTFFWGSFYCILSNYPSCEKFAQNKKNSHSPRINFCESLIFFGFNLDLPLRRLGERERDLDLENLGAVRRYGLRLRDRDLNMLNLTNKKTPNQVVDSLQEQFDKIKVCV